MLFFPLYLRIIFFTNAFSEPYTIVLQEQLQQIISTNFLKQNTTKDVPVIKDDYRNISLFSYLHGRFVRFIACLQFIGV